MDGEETLSTVSLPEVGVSASSNGAGVAGVASASGIKSDHFGNLVVPVGGGVFGSVVVPANLGANSVQEWMNTPGLPQNNAGEYSG